MDKSSSLHTQTNNPHPHLKLKLTYRNFYLILKIITTLQLTSYILINLQNMVDRLKDAASFLKAKWNKDELTELLITATNDDECQSSTAIINQISSATFSIDDWPKMWQFILQKLKSAKTIRVNKSLNLVEHILKNGNPQVCRDIKEQIRVFRDLEDFNAKGQTELRISSIRRKAKVIVELINNPRRLEQQRNQAETIKSKLGGNAYTTKTQTSNNSKPNLTTKNTYEGIGSTYYSANDEKEESSISKVTGIASSLMKGLTNKIIGKQDGLLNVNTPNQYSNFAYTEKSEPRVQITPTSQKQPSKLFQNLNVRKPKTEMGITKTHSNTESGLKKQSSINSQSNIPSSNVNFFENKTSGSQGKIPDNIDLFSAQPSMGVSQNNGSTSFGDIDFLGLGAPSSGAAQPNFNFTNQKNSLDIFGSCSSTGVYVDSVKQQQKSVNNTAVNFDIFQVSSGKALQKNNQIRMNTVAQDVGLSDPKTKYDMFQQFLF